MRGGVEPSTNDVGAESDVSGAAEDQERRPVRVADTGGDAVGAAAGRGTSTAEQGPGSVESVDRDTTGVDPARAGDDDGASGQRTPDTGFDPGGEVGFLLDRSIRASLREDFLWRVDRSARLDALETGVLWNGPVGHVVAQTRARGREYVPVRRCISSDVARSVARLVFAVRGAGHGGGYGRPEASRQDSVAVGRRRRWRRGWWRRIGRKSCAHRRLVVQRSRRREVARARTGAIASPAIEVPTRLRSRAQIDSRREGPVAALPAIDAGGRGGHGSLSVDAHVEGE